MRRSRRGRERDEKDEKKLDGKRVDVDEVHTARVGAWKDCGSGAQLTFRPLVSVRTAKIASVRRGAHG